ncbi:pPIWI_RE module domain-containing protein [Lyngbya sp. CCY1209]|uniref:pPIWI_RE module domain-containing protein n=1 Tax=Lyngbya sp. CCY1209 TaxID=2886103 RepID=UPI002D2116C4|nr:DUF3962 domain-containing protein [Lyngbya sp. CCY1209]MEB3886056.1 DUF3962 domain-containing protein [Lyngbya sp. CCY1209]
MTISLKIAALQLNPNQLHDRYFCLTLPTDLKQVLLADYSRDRPKRGDHPISLPGYQLKALINASVPQIVYVEGSLPTDKPFLFSLNSIPEKRVKTLLKHWVRETFKIAGKKRGKKKPVEQDIKASLAAIDRALFEWDECQLSPEDWKRSDNGTAQPRDRSLFGIIPSIAVARITQNTIGFSEFISEFQSIKFLPALEVASSLFQKPQFCITDVLYSKKKNPYSFMIHPRSLQIPGQPQLYLPLDFGVRRYLAQPYTRTKLPEEFSVMIYTPNGACTAKITEDRYWANNLAELLSKFDYDSVPSADELLLNPLGWSDPNLKLRFFVINREGREKFQDVTAGVTPNDLVYLFEIIAPILQPGFERFEPDIINEGRSKFSKRLPSSCPDSIYYVDFQGVGQALEHEAKKLQLNLIKETDPGLVGMCNPIPVTLEGDWKQRKQDREEIITERVKALPEPYRETKALILPIYPENYFKKRPQEDPYDPIKEHLPGRNLLTKSLTVPVNENDEKEVKELPHKCKATLLAMKCRLGYHDGLIPKALKAYGLPSDLQTIGTYLHKLSNGNYLPVATKLDSQGILTGRTATSTWQPLREFIPDIQAETNFKGCQGPILQRLVSTFFKELMNLPNSTLLLPYANNMRQAIKGLRDPYFGTKETIYLLDNNDEIEPFELPKNCRIIRCRDGGEMPQATLWNNDKNQPKRGRAIAKLADNSYLLIRPKAATDQTNSQESMLRLYENKSGKLIQPKTNTIAKKIALVEVNPLLKPDDEPLNWLAYLQYLQKIAPQYDNFLQLPLVLHIPRTFF